VRPPRFLHVTVSYTAAVSVEVLDNVIESECFDWFRYSWWCYLIWSSSDCETICRKLCRIPGIDKSNIFVVAMDLSDGFGSLPKFLWEWLQKDRGYGVAVSLWAPPDIVQPVPPPLSELPPPKEE
jgi:hypothetical protein